MSKERSETPRRSTCLTGGHAAAATACGRQLPSGRRWSSPCPATVFTAPQLRVSRRFLNATGLSFGMARSHGPWSPSTRCRASDRRFIAVVLTVVVGAFLVTLNWPDEIPMRSQTAPAVQPLRQPAQGRGRLICSVAYINDGDTLRCRDGTRIRLHAVAARESDETCSTGHPCPAASAASATAELRRLASGRTIRCEPTGRSHDRVTAICWTPSEQEINCAMIRSGTTLIWDRFNRQSALCRS